MNLFDYINQKYYGGQIQLKTKQDNWIWSFLNFFYTLITGRDLHDYTSVIGKTIWTHDLWEYSIEYQKEAVLNHELVHLNQFNYGIQHENLDLYPEAKKKSFLFRWWNMLAYLFFPLPSRFAFSRADAEIKAFAATGRVYKRVYGKVPDHFYLWVEDQLSGPTYFWTVSESKAKELVEDLRKELEL